MPADVVNEYCTLLLIHADGKTEYCILLLLHALWLELSTGNPLAQHADG